MNNELSHLNALRPRLSHEHGYQATARANRDAATTQAKAEKFNREIELRKVWIFQIEGEIYSEIKFLASRGIVVTDEPTAEEKEMSIEEIMAELEV